MGEKEFSSNFIAQRWLERTPGVTGDFNFAAKYKEAIDKILVESLELIEAG